MQTTGSRSRKTIEETYQKRDHILLYPHTYIGSIEKQTQNLWVYENGEMVNRRVSYVPGLFKIFDEILVNAADNKQRDPKMDSVKVVIDVEQHLISICNSGDGIPVEIHQEEGVYVPEMIFGHLLSGSNYDDNVKKTTGGRNGYGATLTNIFSTEFTIETADGKRQKKYKQVFENNMGKKSEPVITKCNKSDNWTKVSFKPDLGKFGMTHLEDDVVALMSKRVFDIAGCLGKTVKVELNGERIPIKSFSDYVDLYLTAANESWNRPVPRIVERVNNRWEVGVSISEGRFQQVSFVNSIATIKGGTHVNHVTNQITNYILGILNERDKTANFTTHNVKHQLWVFVNSLIDNPAFDSQTKETFTLRQSSFGSKCELSEDILNKVAKFGVVESLLAWATFNQEKELKRKRDGAKTDRVQVEKRKKVNVENLELELRKLENKVKFIHGVVRGEIIVNNRKKADLVQELSQRGFTPFSKMAQPVEESSAVPASSSTFIPDSEYDYLLSLAIATLTIEKMQELCKDRDKMMKKATTSSLWLRDLESLDELDKKDRDAAQKKLAPKKQAPRKTKGDKDEEMMDTAQGIAQYNFGSTSENPSFCEVAAPAKGGRKPAAASKVAKPPAAPRKRGAAASKKQPVAEVVSVSPDKKVRKTRSGSVLGRLTNKEVEA